MCLCRRHTGWFLSTSVPETSAGVRQVDRQHQSNRQHATCNPYNERATDATSCATTKHTTPCNIASAPSSRTIVSSACVNERYLRVHTRVYPARCQRALAPPKATGFSVEGLVASHPHARAHARAHAPRAHARTNSAERFWRLTGAVATASVARTDVTRRAQSRCRCGKG
jgi:hypothetical protein